MKVRMNPNMFENFSRIEYPTSPCSDGLCCFLDKRQAHFLRVKLSNKMALTLVHLPMPGNNGLIERVKADIYNRSEEPLFACEHLRLVNPPHDGKIKLQLRCSAYGAERSEVCKKYPFNSETGKIAECVYHDYFRGQKVNMQYISHLFASEFFPELREMASGTATNIFGEQYHIIPLDFRRKSMQVCTPLDLADHGDWDYELGRERKCSAMCIRDI